MIRFSSDSITVSIELHLNLLDEKPEKLGKKPIIFKFDVFPDQNRAFKTENRHFESKIVSRSSKILGFRQLGVSTTFRKIEIDKGKKSRFLNIDFSRSKSFFSDRNLFDQKSSLSSKNFDNRKFCQLFEKIEIENSNFFTLTNEIEDRDKINFD